MRVPAASSIAGADPEYCGCIGQKQRQAAKLRSGPGCVIVGYCTKGSGTSPAGRARHFRTP
ncbi:hypothetical protein CFAM422_007230 [Trichoderma lentiforme]|uniref:Uncharacterized protein n=1 Tax=Trichoderma lentiforme TaxID=1567552 RepID=A0A9P5CCJ3_9HYPO|nr:hypothetical protein CFAM422_007230 [Trichoderma lentiforme]